MVKSRYTSDDCKTFNFFECLTIFIIKCQGQKKAKSTAEVRKHWHLSAVSKCQGREFFYWALVKVEPHAQNADFHMTQR